MKELRVVISGGGTGGHIFPAVSIANAVRELRPDAKILFVGAEGRMEMQRVPQAGYEIVGLPIRGFLRPLWKPGNIGVALDYLKSKRMAKKAAKICVAYEGMERFFPKDKIMMTGNPVRQSLLDTKITREEALQSFGLQADKRTVLLVGGSLGARTINESVLQHLDEIRHSGVQFIWQTGKYYSAQIAEKLEQEGCPENLVVSDFIADMGAAYRAADLVISRAGASSISEFCLIGKAVILVPSPNVAEDHQTKNAMALVKNGAALCVKDNEAAEKLIPMAVDVVNDAALLESLSENVLKMGYPNSAKVIAKEVLKLAGAE